jgi:hypothetical protein
MDIKFPDGKNHTMWALMEAIPEIVVEMLPVEASDDDKILRRAIDHLELEVSGGKKFVLHALPGGRVVISNRTLEFLWSFTYAITSIYTKHFAGEQKQAEMVNLGDDEEMRLPLAMLAWMHSFQAAGGYCDFEQGFPIPDPHASLDSIEGKALHLVRHVIRFVLLHELSHVAFEIDHNAPAERLEEETQCDLRAIAWMQLRKPLTETDYRRTKTGSAIALLFVAAVGIESGNYDGINHPVVYHRPINTLDVQFGRKEHGVWGLCLAVLALHSGNVGIKVPWEKMGYYEFRDAVVALRDHIDEVRKS